MSTIHLSQSGSARGKSRRQRPARVSSLRSEASRHNPATWTRFRVSLYLMNSCRSRTCARGSHLALETFQLAPGTLDAFGALEDGELAGEDAPLESPGDLPPGKSALPAARLPVVEAMLQLYDQAAVETGRTGLPGEAGRGSPGDPSRPHAPARGPAVEEARAHGLGGAAGEKPVPGAHAVRPGHHPSPQGLDGGVEGRKGGVMPSSRSLRRFRGIRPPMFVYTARSTSNPG